MNDNSKIEKPAKRQAVVFLLPLVLFAGLCALFFLQLTSGRDTSTVPSALIGKPVPTFELPPLEGSNRSGFSSKSLAKTKISLINVWASWCIPCRAEHPFVEKLSQDERIAMFGLNHKDRKNAALSFLQELGNPYDAIGVDPKGRVSIDFGVYGVPETFVVDESGTIVHKFIGPITQSRLDNELMPAIEKALTQ